MSRYVSTWQEIDQTQVALVGGKGANLAELSRIEGVRVPPGFCVTTEAFRRITTDAIGEKLDRLSGVEADDRDAIGTISASIRRTIREIVVPDEIATAITDHVRALGEGDAYAVRSSATAEDLPTASFAGQHDSYLNIVGPAAVRQHVVRCWASLFTERAVAYRLRNGIDHRAVRMAVVVQRMAVPVASGIMFTADPVTSNRTIASVDAGFGLGEALVSGLVNPDVFKVRDGRVIDRTVGEKRLAIVPVDGGGTEHREIEPSRRAQPALTDAEAVRLVELGRRIEASFGVPQDIEWCLTGDGFEIVQSRPITTLFPIPEAGDGENHVYLSVGHQQMMTDAMKPLGLSFWQMTTPAPMAEAGGRLFVDITPRLAGPAARADLLDVVGKNDPLTGNALRTILEREDFIRPVPDADAPPPVLGHYEPIDPDPAIVTGLIADAQASLAEAERGIATKTGDELLDFIRADIQELRRVMTDPRSRPVYMTAMEASWWLNENLAEWLGEKNVADTLTQSAPHNITSEMGLALLDVADAIRPYPELIEFLQHADGPGFLDHLPELPGGREARDVIVSYLDRFGMRCVGEIDITRPRWCERPDALIPMILGNVRNFEPGGAQRFFEQGLREAEEKERDVLARLRAQPGGAERAAETKRMIDRVRTFIGYREYPKYHMIGRYLVHKRALLAEADRLVADRVLRDREDIFFLRFDELYDVVRTSKVDETLIAERRARFAVYETLTPPRVLTSEGEALTGSYGRDDMPPGALVGLPVSAGVVEGRARVVLDIADADLAPGDILVTAYTDPSWTPVFVTAEGLVTEVGGVMTHGAVVAREYGLPAVVGVDGATRRIRDGERIRVHGTDGYVELLD